MTHTEFLRCHRISNSLKRQRPFAFYLPSNVRLATAHLRGERREEAAAWATGRPGRIRAMFRQKFKLEERKKAKVKR